jgi:hypothetical protein
MPSSFEADTTSFGETLAGKSRHRSQRERSLADRTVRVGIGRKIGILYAIGDSPLLAHLLEKTWQKR